MVSDPQWFNADPDPGVFQISDHELLLRHNMFFLYKKSVLRIRNLRFIPDPNVYGTGTVIYDMMSGLLRLILR